MEQDELPFDRPGPDGAATWHQQRQAQQRELARDVGLPIGKWVVIELSDGSGMEGLLELEEQLLWVKFGERLDLRLKVGRCTFRVRDIAACSIKDRPGHA